MNPKPTIFIGSSTEQLEIAEIIELNLSEVAEITCWKHIFKPGHPTLSALTDIKDKFDFAIMILTSDDILVSKDTEYDVPRDNVIFELGLFIGSIGNDRVYAVCDKNSKTKILSDYLGITYITFDLNRNDKDLARALSPTCIRIKQSIKNLGIRKHLNSGIVDDYKTWLNSLVGLEKVFPTYDDAEVEILNELKTTSGPVRMFLQIASQNIGIKGSLYDLIYEASQKNIEMRILHALKNSDLYSKNRLLALGKNPEPVISSLKYVTKSLEELSKQSGTSLRHRTHNWPYIWRMYCFEKKLYLMPYFSNKDATKKSPVLVFKNQIPSLYSTFIDWFDYVWDQNAPKKLSISDIITPATPAGTALFLTWNDYHVFGITKRDLRKKSEYLRFSGLGGKRNNSNETWVECAIREGNEETGNSIGEIIQEEKTHLLRADGTLEELKIINEIKVPSLIIEKRHHTGEGSMKKSDDHYYLVAFKGTLAQKPTPTREIAILLYIKQQQLSLLKKRDDVTLGELIENGAKIEKQEGVIVDMQSYLVPHGTASYLVRQLSE